MVIFDFSLPSHDLRNKELKTVALKDILATTCDHPSALAEQQYQEIINMVCARQKPQALTSC